MTKLDIIAINNASNAIANEFEKRTGAIINVWSWNLVKNAAFKVLTEVQEKEDDKKKSINR